jgi:ATP adenylyltransferase
MKKEMLLKKIWAPWREVYVTQKKRKGCFLCDEIKKKTHHQASFIVQSRLSYILLNIYPYNTGHLLISPKRHVSSLSKMTSQEITDLFELVKRGQKALKKVLHPHGYNIGINDGRAAGAGVVGHLHVHIVPRWVGDTNFMTAVGHTKILSQSLKSLRVRLQDAC